MPAVAVVVVLDLGSGPLPPGRREVPRRRSRSVAPRSRSRPPASSFFFCFSAERAFFKPEKRRAFRVELGFLGVQTVPGVVL